MTRPFTLLGHRGARGLFPENTLEGFRAAIALGLRAIELDVGVLRDGTVVVHHDPALNPHVARLDGRWISGAPPLLHDLTMAELRRYDVGRIDPGSPYAARYPLQLPADGARIPTLAEALALDQRVTWLIELKLMPDHPAWTIGAEEMVERVLHVIDAADAAGRVILQSFDWRAPRHARHLRPDLRCGWLTMPQSTDDATLWRGMNASLSPPEAVAAEGGGLWTPDAQELTQEWLARAHQLGLTVIPWTVNDAATMSRLLTWGVDGLITDRPDRALPLLRQGPKED